MTEAHLRIHLFGTFNLFGGDQPITSLNAARLQSLLAYLLIHRAAPQTRQQIAFLFWPDTSDAQAQTNLRQLLFRIRNRLPRADEFLTVDERTVGWRIDADYTLDVEEFEVALRAASAADGPVKINALERVAAVYAGDLLPNCYDDWLIPVRERLAQDYVAAMEQLVLLHEEHRNYEAAIVYARTLLRYDPLHEASTRRLMRLLALTGDRTVALRVYHACASLLEQELGVEPGPATREVYERLLHLGGVLSPVRSRRMPLVGRQSEWQRLQALWRVINRGRLNIVCIEGVAGLGKTRLAEELIHWAQSQGVRTLHARAYVEEGLSYGPLVECLRSETLQTRLARLPKVWRSELARLLPELLIADPLLAAPEPLTERGQRRRLFEALTHAILIDDRPLILALDDLQWCDKETLAWLLFIAHHHAHSRLLIVTTLRHDELMQSHPATNFLLELRRLDLLAELPLAALDITETTELAESIAERELEKGMAASLFAATEGNPLFVVEIMRAQLAGGSTPTPSLALPPKVHAVIGARLAQLSAPAHDLARLAATIGRSFTADVLSAACEQDDETVARSLDELWQRRIVREQDVNGYDFTHDRLREVAYAELQPARRRLLHRRVALALEQVHGPADDSISGQIAVHFRLAGDAQTAIGWYQRAVDRALRLFAYQDAITMLETGLSMMRLLPSSPTSVELELELQIRLCTAWASITSYHGQEADVAYVRALELCRQVKQTPHLFTVLWGLHEVALYRAEYAESLALARQCLEIATDLGDPGLLLEAHHAIWGPCFFLGDYEQALTHMEIGLAIYDRAEHEPLSVHYGVHDAGSCALYESALALWNMGYLDQARRQLARTTSLGQELSLPANIADTYTYAGLCYQLLRDPSAVQKFAEPALQISKDKGYPYSRILGAGLLGWSLSMQGQTAEGLTLAHQAMAAVEEYDQKVHYSQLAAMLAECLMLAGRYAEAVDVADEALVCFEKFRDLLCAPDLWTIRGEALLALGASHDEIEASYHSAMTLAQELGAKTSELRATVHLARLRLMDGDPSESRSMLSVVYNWFSEGFDTPDLCVAKDLLDELSA